MVSEAADYKSGTKFMKLIFFNFDHQIFAKLFNVHVLFLIFGSADHESGIRCAEFMFKRVIQRSWILMQEFFHRFSTLLRSTFYHMLVVKMKVLNYINTVELTFLLLWHWKVDVFFLNNTYWMYKNYMIWRGTAYGVDSFVNRIIRGVVSEYTNLKHCCIIKAKSL